MHVPVKDPRLQDFLRNIYGEGILKYDPLYSLSVRLVRTCSLLLHNISKDSIVYF